MGRPLPHAREREIVSLPALGMGRFLWLAIRVAERRILDTTFEYVKNVCLDRS